jgi:glycosyltransferase involved in cell wall biosynthesis
MMEKLVSVLIPVFNAEKYLEKCLNSILAQTYKNIEIVIVDDGSTDQSFNVAGKLESSYNNIKIFSQCNRGAASARNKAFELCGGEYIQYFDADDIMHPEKIASQMKLLETHGFDPGIVSIGRWARFWGDTACSTVQDLRIYRDYDDSVEFLADCWENAQYAVGPTWLVHRSIVEKTGGWNPEISVLDDGVFFAKAAMASSKILFCEESLIYWRQETPGSLSKDRSERGVASHLKACREYAKIVEKYLHDPKIRHALAMEYTKFLYVAYPSFPSLVKEAQKDLKALGFDKPLSLPTPKFRAASALLGFYATARLFQLKDKMSKKVRALSGGRTPCTF